MKSRVIVGTLLVLGLCGPALAGPLIITPALRPPAGGVVQCIAANASATKTIEVSMTIYQFTGMVAYSTVLPAQLLPNTSVGTGFIPVTQGHCVVEVVSGGKKNARVTLEVRDAGSNILAAVSGQ